MKKQYIKVLSIELLLAIFSFFHFIMLKQFNITLYVLELAFIYIVLDVIFKMKKRGSHLNKYFLLLIIIICLCYYALTYFAGFFIGFVETVYSRSLPTMFFNVFLSVVFIFLLENIREIIIEQGRYYKSLIVFSVIPIIMLELLFSISLINFTDRVTILQISLSLIIPCIFKNIFLTYATYFFGNIGNIIYNILMVTVTYTLPAFPAFSDYISTMINVFVPLLTLILSLNYVFVKNDKIVDSASYYKDIRKERAAFAVVLIILLLFVYLISDLGRFTILAIGSDSMKGTIDKGDVVFLDKNVKEYKIGDVIAFTYGGTTIVHRIVDINKGENTTYVTKGDYNNAEDNWLITDKDIKAKCKFIIKYLGWPTVLLSEFLSEK